MTENIDRKGDTAVRVTDLVADPDCVQTEFIRNSAVLGTSRIGVFDVIDNPAGAYPDPPLSEYSLQIATAGTAHAEFDLGAVKFRSNFTRGTMLLAPPDTACDYILNDTFSIINLGLPTALFDEAMQAFDGAHRPDLEKLHRMDFRDPRIEGLASVIAGQSRTGHGMDPLAVDHAAFGIVGLLVDKADKITRRPGTPTPLGDVEFARVVDMMQDHIE